MFGDPFHNNSRIHIKAIAFFQVNFVDLFGSFGDSTNVRYTHLYYVQFVLPHKMCIILTCTTCSGVWSPADHKKIMCLKN